METCGWLNLSTTHTCTSFSSAALPAYSTSGSVIRVENCSNAMVKSGTKRRVCLSAPRHTESGDSVDTDPRARHTESSSLTQGLYKERIDEPGTGDDNVGPN